MSYNIQDAVKRFAYVSDCKMFSAVMEEKIHISIWESQRDMLDKVRDEIQKEVKLLRITTPGSATSAKDSVPESEKLSVESVIRVLRRLLPTKPEPSFAKLAKVKLDTFDFFISLN